MRAYFTRKPPNIEAVVQNAEYAKAEGMLPTDVNPIARIKLDLEHYTAFCQAPLNDWEFLKPYAENSMFRANTADSVILECPDMISLAVCCEWYSYGRYVGCLVSPFDLMIAVNYIKRFFDAGFEERRMPLLSW